MKSNDYDLVVVGAGGAGLAAAVTAGEAGCSVLVVESEDKIGGSTGLSQGVFTAAGTTVQQALGFSDSADAFFDYYMTLNHWKQPASLVRTFCDNAAPTMEWLMSLGVEYPIQVASKPKGAVWTSASEGPGLYASGVEHPPRGHMPIGNGRAYIDALDQRRAVLGLDLVLKTRVEKLLVENGCVVGVQAGGQDIRAGAVALTCGGFGHNRALLRQYFPEVYEAIPAGDEPTSISAPGSRGDALMLGQQVGAQITGINCGLLGTRPRIRRRPGMPPFLGFQPRSLIYVGRSGRRFTDETAPYAVMPALIKAQGNVVWGIFDEKTRLASDPSKNGWAPEFILECVEHGDFQSAGTIEALAARCGIAPAPLVGAVRRYNEDLPTGRDREFLRDLEGLNAITAPPFYAFEYRASDVNLTGAGVRIDAEGRVLYPDGAVIAGLYAAGEAGAGVLGERYVGGGNAVGNALTMGRIVGKSVARKSGRMQ